MKNKNIKNIDHTEFRYRPFKFMFFIMQEYRWTMVVIIMTIAISEFFFGGTVYFLGKLTDALNDNSAGTDLAIVYNWAWLLIGFFAISSIFWRISGFIGAYTTIRLEAKSFYVTFNYLIRHSSGYFSNRLVGKLSSKVSNIARSIEKIFPMIFWDFLRIIVKFLTLCVLAFLSNVLIGVIFVGFIIFFIIFNVIISQKLALYSKQRANKASELRGNIVDNLTNVRAIQQNVQTEFEIRNINKYIEYYRISHLKAWRYFEIILTINSLMAIVMLAVTVWVSLYLWEIQIISIGIVVVVVTMVIRLIGDLIFMGAIFNHFMEQYGQLKEGLEEIFVLHEIVDEKDAKKVKIEKSDIVFDKVIFQYKDDKDQSIFKNLSLTIPAGQKIGLVGESGAGKSTFVSLLLRFMDVEKGSIKIGEYDISKIRQDDLRQAIAYVPQEALLFHRTLRDNIKYSYLRATKKEMVQASKRAHALDFINSFPKGFKTFVGERGVKLSGGQKQRVMIARAMLKKSPILVLDEATSSLDSKAEKLIQKALEELMKGRTTIAIAHRLSTLKQMDRIIVFDDGEIAEDGTHEELLKQKGKYYELWQHQVS